MNLSVALGPASTFYAKNFLDISLHKEVICWRHIIAKRWMSAWFSYVINIEFWHWSTKNYFSCHLTSTHSDRPNSSFNKCLASIKSTCKNSCLKLSNKFVFKSESIILWILKIWINHTISNSKTFEVEFQVFFVFEKEVV